MIKLKGIGARLRAERERLRLSRAQLADLGRINRTTELRYEADEYAPSLEFLEAIESAGADANYVISGESATDRAKAIRYSIALVDDLMKEEELDLSSEERSTLVLKLLQFLERNSQLRSKLTIADALKMLA